MQLDIPYFNQTSQINCGPTALRMVVAYVDKDPGLETMEKECNIRPARGLYTLQIGTAAVRRKFRVLFYSKNVGYNPASAELPFYQEFANDTEEFISQIVDEAQQAGVLIEERSIPLPEIFELMKKGFIPIFCVDWNVYAPQEGRKYQGHFVVMTGFDDQNVYVNVPYFTSFGKNIPISHNLFDQMRQAAGTDEDVVFIGK